MQGVGCVDWPRAPLGLLLFFIVFGFCFDQIFEYLVLQGGAYCHMGDRSLDLRVACFVSNPREVFSAPLPVSALDPACL